MIYQLADIMRDIKIAIDENDGNDALRVDMDADTLTMDDIIKSKIVEAVKTVTASAPAILLVDDAKPMFRGIEWLKDGVGRIILPDDYFRIVVFKMDDWETPVHTVVTPSDPRYAWQHSRVKGLRGNPQKPVVALVPTHNGMAMEFFSCKSEDAKIEHSLYLPEPAFDKNGGIRISDRLYKSVVYLAAALVCLTIGRADMSQILVQLSKESAI